VPNRPNRPRAEPYRFEPSHAEGRHSLPYPQRRVAPCVCLTGPIPIRARAPVLPAIRAPRIATARTLLTRATGPLASRARAVRLPCRAPLAAPQMAAGTMPRASTIVAPARVPGRRIGVFTIRTVTIVATVPTVPTLETRPARRPPSRITPPLLSKFSGQYPVIFDHTGAARVVQPPKQIPP